MHESTADLVALQGLLDASIEQAGAFLRDSMELDTNSLDARQIARYLQGSHTVSLATVTARGEPRVAPITAIFVGGRYVIPTVVDAARSRHLRKRPGVSLTHYDGNDMAITIHGQAELIGAEHPDFERLDTCYRKSEGSDGPSAWGGGGPLYIRVQPDVMYATSRKLSQFPE